MSKARDCFSLQRLLILGYITNAARMCYINIGVMTPLSSTPISY